MALFNESMDINMLEVIKMSDKSSARGIKNKIEKYVFYEKKKRLSISNNIDLRITFKLGKSREKLLFEVFFSYGGKTMNAKH